MQPANTRRIRERPPSTATGDGRAPAKGERFHNPALPATLGRIAAGGRDAFYRGEIAARIASYMKEQGGFLSERDLAAHRSEWVEPVASSYRGLEVWEIPPNGQGIAALQILNILEGFDLGAEGFGSARTLHWMIEAKKLAFEDRARFYADPDFARVRWSGWSRRSTRGSAAR